MICLINLLPVENQQDVNNFIKYADTMLNDSTKKANDLNEKLKKYKNSREKNTNGAK